MGIRNKFMSAAILGLWPFLSLPLAADHCCECCAQFAESTKVMFPTNLESLSQFYLDTKEEIDQVFENASHEATFENTVLQWDKKVRSLINRLTVLQSIGVIIDDIEVISAAGLYLYDLALHFTKEIALHPESIEQIVSYLENADLEPYQVHLALNLLQGNVHGLGMHERIEALREKLYAQSSQTFTYRAGNAEKLSTEKDSISLMSLNVCNLPENLPLIFGGILPWKDRVEGIIQKIKEHLPDVLCLQEVFEREGNEELYDALKEDYAHFYLHIGPRNAGFDPQNFGLASGLFVASKYPIENPRFRLYNVIGLPLNRGVFDFVVGYSHFYNTHLEAFDHDLGQHCRAEEMKELAEIIKQETREGVISIACGDMNIHWNQEEKAKQILLENFYSPLTEALESITMANRTYLDYTDFWWKAHAELGSFVEKPEVFDYVLLSKDTGGAIIAKIISMNDEDRPMHALSDHQAIFAEIYKEAP